VSWFGGARGRAVGGTWQAPSPYAPFSRPQSPYDGRVQADWQYDVASGLVVPRKQIASIALPSFSTTWPTTLSNLGAPFTIGDNSGQNSATGPQTTGGTPGVCYALAGDGTDYIATIDGQFNAVDHWAEHVVKFTPGYVAPNTQEIEILLAFTLASGQSKGYELDFWFAGATLQPVRWNNGATSSYDFAAVTTVSGTWPGSVSDGDVIRGHYHVSGGNPLIEVYLNNVLQITFTDITAGKITSGGSPGLGFFARTGTGYDATKYCSKRFSAGSGS
jgi:hypothetical protein